MYRSIILVAGCCAFLLLAGCRSSKQPVVVPVDNSMTLRIVGAPNLNSTGEASSANAAIIRVYQLAGTTNFRGTTPEQLFLRDEKEALSDELISKQQVELFPNEVESLVLEPAPNAQYLGVAADFRNPDRDQWRQVYPVSELKGRRVRIEVGAGSLTIRLE